MRHARLPLIVSALASGFAPQLELRDRKETALLVVRWNPSPPLRGRGQGEGD